MAEQQPQGTVSLQDLGVEQLAQVKKQLDEELDQLSKAFGSLRQAQSKFTSCMEAIDQVKPANKDKKILIPLTNSLYIPGQLADTENVIVDVGTGYYVDKSTRAAKTLYNGKILALKSNLSQLQAQIEKKSDNANAVVEMIQFKMTQQQQAQKAGAA